MDYLRGARSQQQTPARREAGGPWRGTDNEWKEPQRVAKDKRPSFQFYAGDWLKDPDLSCCSAAARGVYMDVLCLMFESGQRGVLISDQHVWTLEETAQAVRGDSTANLALLRELAGKAVLRKRKTDGAYYSARLVRDERIRQERAKAGVQGGRPTESKTKANRKQTAKQNRTPSSSSSSSTSVRAPPAPPPGGTTWEKFCANLKGDALRTPEMQEAWADWETNRKEIGKPLKPTAIRLQAKKLEAMGHERAVAALRNSSTNSYQGIVEPRESRASPKTGGGPSHRAAQADREYGGAQKPLPRL